MTTPLERPLRRAVLIDGTPYVVIIHPGGLRLVRKGRRKGIELTWEQLLDDEARAAGPAARAAAPGLEG